STIPYTRGSALRHLLEQSTSLRHIVTALHSPIPPSSPIPSFTRPSEDAIVEMRGMKRSTIESDRESSRGMQIGFYDKICKLQRNRDSSLPRLGKFRFDRSRNCKMRERMRERIQWKKCSLTSAR
ncbi:hypothetical protein PMAYCL1PPCAC_28102, partial [Pristionchus mayeri]